MAIMRSRKVGIEVNSRMSNEASRSARPTSLQASKAQWAKSFEKPSLMK